MPVPRVVLDANVFISALLGKGSPSRLYEAFKAGKLELVCSKPLLAELAEVLFRQEFAIQPGEIKALFRLLRQKSTIVRPSQRVRACRDPKDNAVLECAFEGKASAIVSGDGDLLSLHPFRSIPILSPRIFVAALKS